MQQKKFQGAHWQPAACSQGPSLRPAPKRQMLTRPCLTPWASLGPVLLPHPGPRGRSTESTWTHTGTSLPCEVLAGVTTVNKSALFFTSPAETTTRTSAPGRENNLTVTSRATGDAQVSSPHPGYSTSMAAPGSSEHPRAPLPSTPTAMSQTQAGSVQSTGEPRHARWTETNPGVASNIMETAVSPSPPEEVPGLSALKSSPPKGTSPREAMEARGDPLELPLDQAKSRPVSAGSMPSEV